MTIKKKKILSKANRSLKEKTTIVKNTVSQLDKEVNSSFSENSLKMLQKRYLARRADGTQETPADMMRRVAKAIAVVEKNYGHNEQFIQKTEKQFFEILARHEYTPA